MASVSNAVKKEKLQKDADAALELESKTDSVKTLVEDCIEKTGEKAILILGYRGGKEDLVGPYLDEQLFDANYLYNMGETSAPTVEEMENSLETLVEKNLKKCTGKMDYSRSLDVSPEIINYNLLFDSMVAETGDIDATVKIENDNTLLTVTWPLIVTVGEQKKEITNFPMQKYNADLEKLSLFSQEFVTQLNYDPYVIDAFYLLKQNYTIDVGLVNNDTYVFLITDNSSMIDYTPLKFLFAAKVGETPLVEVEG
jgi:hypothetical protein